MQRNRPPLKKRTFQSWQNGLDSNLVHAHHCLPRHADMNSNVAKLMYMTLCATSSKLVVLYPKAPPPPQKKGYYYVNNQ